MRKIIKSLLADLEDSLALHGHHDAAEYAYQAYRWVNRVGRKHKLVGVSTLGC